MTFKTTREIRRIVGQDGCVNFTVKITPHDGFNTLLIKRNGKLIAKDSNVQEETYCLPAGDYVLRLRIEAEQGTESELTLVTSTRTKVRKVKVRNGNVTASTRVELDL